MKNLLYFSFMLTCVFLPFSLSAATDHDPTILDGTKVVSDFDSEYLDEDEYTSVSQFIRETLVLPKSKLQKIETLNFKGAGIDKESLSTIKDQLLPWLSNLKFINLYSASLTEEAALPLLLTILQNFEKINHINIVFNPITDNVSSFLETQSDEDKKLFEQKIIFIDLNTFRAIAPNLQLSHKVFITHASYYIENLNIFRKTLPKELNDLEPLVRALSSLTVR